jgi:hypothetical protein
MTNLDRIALNYAFIAFLILLCPDTYAFQEDPDEDEEGKEKDKIELAFHLAAGYSLGGQMFDEVIIVESGTSFEFITEVKASSRVFYGLGLGYDKLDTESFMPVFLSFKGLLNKKDNCPYMSFRMGYSFGRDKDFNAYDNYDYRGGLIFGAGIGRMFDVRDKFRIMLSISLNHQFVRIDYETYDSARFTENINYDLLTFRLGIML